MYPDDNSLPGGAATRPCPICGRPAVAGLRPFCSQRCAMIDLGRWLGGGYRVPAEEAPDDEAAADKPGSAIDER